MNIKALVLAVSSAFACHAPAAIIINEILINPPGTDNGSEFFELWSTTQGVEALSGLWFIEIDGDTTNAGLVNSAINLGAFSTGTNGLFLRRDSATALLPAPDTATTVSVVDFAPDFQNGSSTYVLVSNFTGAVGNDLDADNNGILDGALPWATVLDTVGFAENDAGNNFTYAVALGGYAFPQLPYTPDSLVRYGNGGIWLGADLHGSAPGPFQLEDIETTTQDGSPSPTGLSLTPGAANQVVPEAGTSLLALVGGVGLAGRRRRA
jgi:uncharacterized protein